MTKYEKENYEKAFKEDVEDGVTSYIMDGHAARCEDYRAYWNWLIDTNRIEVVEYSDGQINTTTKKGAIHRAFQSFTQLQKSCKS